jgi:alkylation response protein AidB-like acyl-CoA dehydrogenase
VADELLATTASERAEFRSGIRAFLTQYSPESEVRRLMDDALGYDPEVWSQLSRQLGLPAVIVPDVNGGQGLSFVELSVVLEEVGRALLPAPILTSAGIATSAITLAAPSAARDELLTGLAAGTLIATLADIDAASPVTADSQSRLTGTVTRVLDSQIADIVLVPARYESHLALFAVRLDADGFGASDLATFDLTRKQAGLTLDSVAGVLLDTDYATQLARVRDIAAILASAEMLGAAQKALDLSVEYALTREQFGALIGSFQAIKHLLADDLARVEQMRAAVGAGAQVAIDGSDEELAEVAGVVKAYCSRAATLVAQNLIQVLGGIGYTWEHPAHLYLRRIRSLGMLYGTPAEHRHRLAVTFGLS